MSETGISVDQLPSPLRDIDEWVIVKRTEQGELHKVDLSDEFTDVSRPRGLSLGDAVSYIQSHDGDLHLVCFCPSDLVVLRWHFDDYNQYLQDQRYATTLSRLGSFTERIQEGPALQTFLKVPLKSGQLETDIVSIHQNPHKYPVWTPTTKNAILPGFDTEIRHLTEREFFDIMKSYFPWSATIPEPSGSDHESWLFSTIQERERWASVDPRHDLSDAELLERAMNARVSGKWFKDLMGNTPENVPVSDPKARQALMNLLAYWFCFDTAKMKQYYNQSHVANRTRVFGDGTTNVDRLVARSLTFVEDCYRHTYRDGEVTPRKQTWHPNHMDVNFPGGT